MVRAAPEKGICTSKPVFCKIKAKWCGLIWLFVFVLKYMMLKAGKIQQTFAKILPE
jgi:hypothetical protein